MNVHRIAGTDSKTSRETAVPQPPFRWQTRIALPVGLLLVAAVLLLVTAWGTIFPGRPVTVVPAMVRSVSGAVGTTSVTASGWLEPDPYAVYATALASGTVESVLALEGEAVTKGQPLAELVADDAKIELRATEANLEIARADLVSAKAAFVSTEEILEQLVDRRRALASAVAKVAEAEADRVRLVEAIASEAAAVATLRDEVERKRDLVESGAVSRGEFARLQLTLDARERGLEATRKQRAILDSRLASAKADRDAAEQHLELRIEERRDVDMARAGVVRAEAMLAKATAERDAARLRLDRMTIASPIDGVVLRRIVAPGSRVTVESGEGARVFHLYDPASMQARVDVPLADAAAIGIDQEAVLEVQTLPDREFRGRVTRLVHEADIQKNTVEVKVAIEAPDERLKPEMLVRARFLAQVQESTNEPATRDVVLVPERLARQGAVWVVESRSGNRGVARRRPVEVGTRRVEDWIEVVSGIRPGDRLIVDVPSDLEDGDRVIVRQEEGS